MLKMNVGMNMNAVVSTLALAMSFVACTANARVNNPPEVVHTTSGSPQQRHEVPVAGGWEKLGERVVNGRTDHDVIHVGKSDGRFTSIQLKADGNLVELFDVVVTFGDGEKFSPNTRLIFDKNTRSRVIDLPGDKRVIQRVEFKFGKIPGEGKASMELWGKSA